MPDLQNLLDQIDRLDQEATPGPWTTDSTPDEFGIIWGAVEQIGGGFGERAMVTEIMEEHADAEFIALARTALPQLAAGIRRLRECAQTLTEDNNDASDYASGIHEAVECFEHIITDALGADDAS